jgi:polysaccharide pyruvyl transferase WcaK-like protein
MSNVKILLGGVPFGCNNIGDEAILERIVNIVRTASPKAEITVSTGDPTGTKSLLGVNTCSLYSGFSENETDKTSFVQTLKSMDVFIWSGATGLSDYPNTSLDCLAAAQQLGLKTVVFCTGMNDTLNPAHFKLNQGMKKSLFNVVNKITGNRINLAEQYEVAKESKLRSRLKTVLDQCDLVINRDEQSKVELMKSHLSIPPLVAADPAITLKVEEPTELNWGPETLAVLNSPNKKIGICISSQQSISQINSFIEWLDTVVKTYQANIVFIPMNPITDFEMMTNIRDKMYHKDKTVIAVGSDSPDAIVGLASKMDVIISSRLHLLIFASITGTPCIGIGRGSKISNFLSEFGFCTAGDTQLIEFYYLEKELKKLLKDQKMYRDISALVHKRMLDRLDVGVQALSTIINQSNRHLV